MEKLIFLVALTACCLAAPTSEKEVNNSLALLQRPSPINPDVISDPKPQEEKIIIKLEPNEFVDKSAKIMTNMEKIEILKESQKDQDQSSPRPERAIPFTIRPRTEKTPLKDKSDDKVVTNEMKTSASDAQQPCKCSGGATQGQSSVLPKSNQNLPENPKEERYEVKANITENDQIKGSKSSENVAVLIPLKNIDEAIQQKEEKASANFVEMIIDIEEKRNSEIDTHSTTKRDVEEKESSHLNKENTKPQKTCGFVFSQVSFDVKEKKAEEKFGDDTTDKQQTTYLQENSYKDPSVSFKEVEQSSAGSTDRFTSEKSFRKTSDGETIKSQKKRDVINDKVDSEKETKEQEYTQDFLVGVNLEEATKKENKESSKGEINEIKVEEQAKNSNLTDTDRFDLFKNNSLVSSEQEESSNENKEKDSLELTLKNIENNDIKQSKADQTYNPSVDNAFENESPLKDNSFPSALKQKLAKSNENSIDQGKPSVLLKSSSSGINLADFISYIDDDAIRRTKRRLNFLNTKHTNEDNIFSFLSASQLSGSNEGSHERSKRSVSINENKLRIKRYLKEPSDNEQDQVMDEDSHLRRIWFKNNENIRPQGWSLSNSPFGDTQLQKSKRETSTADIQHQSELLSYNFFNNLFGRKSSDSIGSNKDNEDEVDELKVPAKEVDEKQAKSAYSSEKLIKSSPDQEEDSTGALNNSNNPNSGYKLYSMGSVSGGGNGVSRAKSRNDFENNQSNEEQSTPLSTSWNGRNQENPYYSNTEEAQFKLGGSKKQKTEKDEEENDESNGENKTDGSKSKQKLKKYEKAKKIQSQSSDHPFLRLLSSPDAELFARTRRHSKNLILSGKKRQARNALPINLSLLFRLPV